MTEQRRLAADVVGYSRLMGRDEAVTVARLRRVRAERLAPITGRHGSRIVRLTGDSTLVEFGRRRGKRLPSNLPVAIEDVPAAIRQ